MASMLLDDCDLSRMPSMNFVRENDEFMEFLSALAHDDAQGDTARDASAQQPSSQPQLDSKHASDTDNPFSDGCCGLGGQVRAQNHLHYLCLCARAVTCQVDYAAWPLRSHTKGQVYAR